MEFDLQRFTDTLAEAARGDLALNHWSVHATQRRSLQLGVKDREAGNPHAPLTVSETLTALYLFVWGDGRVTRGSIEHDRLDAPPADLLARAREAAYDDPDAARVHGPAEYPDVPLVDERAAALADGELDELAWRLDRVRRVVDDAGVDTWSGSFHGGRSEGRLRTSAGLDIHGAATSIGWHVTFDGQVGDGYSGRAPEPRGEFDARLDRLVETNDQLKLDPATLQPGPHRVLLHPSVASRYALYTLSHHFSGASIAHGEGRWSPEDFAEQRQVFSERLSLRHDPLRPMQPGSYRYTSEGVPARRTNLIDRGRLGDPLLDLKHAHRLRREPTPVIAGVEAVAWELGDPAGLEETLGSSQPTVVVLSVLGIHTQDRASGDFSLSAPQALVFQDGRCLGPASGTLSGNLFDLLGADDSRIVTFPGEQLPGMLWHCSYAPR